MYKLSCYLISVWFLESQDKSDDLFSAKTGRFAPFVLVKFFFEAMNPSIQPRTPQFR